MKNGMLTIEEAYMAMFYFLSIDYSRGATDEVGGLLGSLSWDMTMDRSPMDAGAWDDWLSAVKMSVANRTEELRNMEETYIDLVKGGPAS
ncbi:hypothetical protein ACEU0C_003699 [Stenotrophomonas indicatrix]|uniref:hypothetical protein n=1 Tax=Stenotrophomonas indicatrix TaxID=2045451 RepID=UPI00373198F3